MEMDIVIWQTLPYINHKKNWKNNYKMPFKVKYIYFAFNHQLSASKASN